MQRSAVAILASASFCPHSHRRRIRASASSATMTVLRTMAAGEERVEDGRRLVRLALAEGEMAVIERR